MICIGFVRARDSTEELRQVKEDKRHTFSDLEGDERNSEARSSGISLIGKACLLCQKLGTFGKHYFHYAGNFFTSNYLELSYCTCFYYMWRKRYK